MGFLEIESNAFSKSIKTDRERERERGGGLGGDMFNVIDARIFAWVIFKKCLVMVLQAVLALPLL